MLTAPADLCAATGPDGRIYAVGGSDTNRVSRVRNYAMRLPSTHVLSGIASVVAPANHV